MSLLVDTSVWSLAFRRDDPPRAPEVEALQQALEGGELVLTTGLVLQEILQGFRGPRARRTILDHFAHLPLLMPNREDHVEAAVLRNRCRRRGIQVGTIDALLARLCIRHDLLLLSADCDFARMAQVVPLSVWRG